MYSVCIVNILRAFPFYCKMVIFFLPYDNEKGDSPNEVLSEDYSSLFSEI